MRSLVPCVFELRDICTIARAANPHNYGLIENRLSGLETRLYVLQTTTSEDQLKQYQRVALEEPLDKILIAAAVFGYAPNLLMRGLQSNKYVSALKSSQTSRSTDTSTQQSEMN